LKRCAELGASRDAQFREDPIDVRADGPVGQVELFSNLSVRESRFSGHPSAKLLADARYLGARTDRGAESNIAAG
jgi:hypothetical protein